MQAKRAIIPTDGQKAFGKRTIILMDETPRSLEPSAKDGLFEELRGKQASSVRGRDEDGSARHCGRADKD